MQTLSLIHALVLTVLFQGFSNMATGEAENPASHSGTSEPVRVLVVTGGHDYETSFYTLFEGNDAFVWDHATSNKEAFRSDIRSKYDVLVLYDMTSDLDADGRKNLKDFVESGKGLVVLHHAILDYSDWPWWYETVVGGIYRDAPFEGMPAATYKHDQEMVLRPAGEHPVTEGVGVITLFDETYKGMWISPDVRVIMETDHPEADRPVVWVSPYKKSRVVYIQPGHGSPAHRHPAYRKLVHNAIVWSAGS